MNLNSLKIVFFTVLSIILSYYIAVLMHEYAHATTAYLLGYKSSPFDIKYGSWYLIPVSEAVDYAGILASGHGTHEALIGISGISITTLLFLICLFFLNRKFIKKRIVLLSFFFWLADMNLMEMFSYINRTFIMGDIGEFIQGFNISPFWIFIPGSVIVCLALYRFYKYELIKMFKLLPIRTTAMRRVFLWTTFWVLPLSIIYWEAPTDWLLLSNSINIISLFIIIFILIVCDPAKGIE